MQYSNQFFKQIKIFSSTLLCVYTADAMPTTDLQQMSPNVEKIQIVNMSAIEILRILNKNKDELKNITNIKNYETFIKSIAVFCFRQLAQKEIEKQFKQNPSSIHIISINLLDYLSIDYKNNHEYNITQEIVESCQEKYEKKLLSILLNQIEFPSNLLTFSCVGFELDIKAIAHEDDVIQFILTKIPQLSLLTKFEIVEMNEKWRSTRFSHQNLTSYIGARLKTRSDFQSIQTRFDRSLQSVSDRNRLLHISYALRHCKNTVKKKNFFDDILDGFNFFKSEHSSNPVIFQKWPHYPNNANSILQYFL